MTPTKLEATDPLWWLAHCEDLLTIYRIAESIITTEHVQPGTEEWALREKGKVLFDQGVDIFNERFAALKDW